MYKWKVEVEENTQLSFWGKVKWSSDKFDKFALEKFLTVLFAAGSSEENPSERCFFWGSKSEIQGKLLFSFSGIDVNGSKRLSPTPSVSNLSLRPCRYLSTVTRSSNQGSVDGFRRGKVAESGEFWFALRAKVSWNKITNGKRNYRLLPGANLRPFSFGESVGPLRWSPQHW